MLGGDKGEREGSVRRPPRPEGCAEISGKNTPEVGLADAPRQGEAALRHNPEAVARSKTEQGPELGFVLSETGSPCCVLSRRVTRCTF